MDPQGGAILQTTLAIIAGGLSTWPIVMGSLALGSGEAFLIFGTMGMQLLPAALSMNDDIKFEIKKRQDTCSEIEVVKTRTQQYDQLISDLDSLDTTQITQKLSDISDDVGASNKKLKYLKEKYYKDLSITVIIYIFIIVVLAYIVTTKKQARNNFFSSLK